MSQEEKDLFDIDTSKTEDMIGDRSGEENASPAWHGIAYDADGRPLERHYLPPIEPPVAKPRRRFGAGVALLASFLIICMICSFVAGYGGYMLADMFRAPTALGGSYTPNGSTGSLSTDKVYSSIGTDGYDYGKVVIGQRTEAEIADTKNGSAGSDALSMIDAIAAVKDSVVEIATTTVSNRGQLSQGAGSGVIIHADGLIVTNHHVISGVDTIYVRLSNGNTYEAYLRGTDEENDIAVLKIMPAETLTVAKLGCSAALAVGEEVFAIGNPLGELGGTVTDGIISALQRDVQMGDGLTMTLLQTNAAINSGNSGGGLFNLSGELIGVVNAKYSATGVEGLGFAIPVDTALVSINALIDHGYIPGRPSLGVELSETSVWIYNKPTTIPYVYDARNSDLLEEGDYIYKIGETVVSSIAELKQALRGYSVGDTVSITVYRNKAWGTMEIVLVEDRPADTSVDFTN